jgi:hypothetical protein
MEMVVSVGAFLVSFMALYLSHLHKSPKAILCLNSRFFDCLSEKTNRELNYTFSNAGNQELYIKDIALLMGPSPLGHLKHDATYLEIPISRLDPFVLKPGEIRPFTVVHEAAYRPPKESHPNQYRYTILSLEVISANGKRYQVAHDISELCATEPALKHPIWKGVPLGSSV